LLKKKLPAALRKPRTFFFSLIEKTEVEVDRYKYMDYELAEWCMLCLSNNNATSPYKCNFVLI